MRIDTALLPRLKALKLLAFDVDGTLTDGAIFLGATDELKRFDVKDGAGLAMARKAGLKIAFVTGRTSECVARRAAELSVDECHQGVGDKVAVLKSIGERHGIAPGEMLFMGDDLPDLPAMKFAGIAACPFDAVEDVRAVCALVSTKGGGKGAAREVAEAVLRARRT